jgi:hypothetical protein
MRPGKILDFTSPSPRMARCHKTSLFSTPRNAQVCTTLLNAKSIYTFRLSYSLVLRMHPKLDAKCENRCQEMGLVRSSISSRVHNDIEIRQSLVELALLVSSTMSLGCLAISTVLSHLKTIKVLERLEHVVFSNIS